MAGFAGAAAVSWPAGTIVELSLDGDCAFCNGTHTEQTDPPWIACAVHFEDAKKILEDEGIPTLHIELPSRVDTRRVAEDLDDE